MRLSWDPPLLILLFLAFSILLLAVPALSYSKYRVCNLAASLGGQKWDFLSLRELFLEPAVTPIEEESPW